MGGLNGEQETLPRPRRAFWPGPSPWSCACRMKHARIVPKPPATPRPARPGGRVPLMSRMAPVSGVHRARAGERGAFPVPARTDESSFTAAMAGAIAPATALRCPVASRGPKPAASARPAPGGRFSPAGSGAGLCRSRTCRSTGHRRAGAGKRGAFPVPARSCIIPDARSLWQGPSPLPQRHAGIRAGRGPKPPASARPAHGGRFSPAGSGAGLSWRLDLPIYRAPSRAGGGNAMRFLSPPGVAFSRMPGLSGRGHRP